MKIYDLLKEDHNKVKGVVSSLIKKYDPQLAEELATELTLHSKAEEEAFYKPLKSKAGKLKIIVDGGHEEHDLTIKMIEQLSKIKNNDKERSSLLSVIQKSLEAHINKEEDDMFKIAKERFSDKEAEKMSITMQEVKEKVKKKL